MRSGVGGGPLEPPSRVGRAGPWKCAAGIRAPAAPRRRNDPGTPARPRCCFAQTGFSGCQRALPAPAASAPMTKTLQLSSSQEVPANDSKGTGTADVSYNKETKMLTYTVNYSGLTGDATMAHIHGTAPKGTNAGVKKDLTPVLKKSASGSFVDSVQIGDQIREDSLLSGMYYFNIHTKKNPGGEIRAQIEF